MILAASMVIFRFSFIFSFSYSLLLFISKTVKEYNLTCAGYISLVALSVPKNIQVLFFCAMTDEVQYIFLYFVV
jgi:hypothetical protein